MSSVSLNFPPTDVILGLGVLPTTAGSSASPATSWLNVSKHAALYFDVLEGASSGTGNGFTLGIEASEVASSTGANFGGVPFYYRQALTTAATDQPGGSTIGAQWGVWTAGTSAGVVLAAATAGRYVQAWASGDLIRASGITSITQTTGVSPAVALDNKYGRCKITTAGTSNGGLFAIAAHWVTPRYEQPIPMPYSTV